MTKEEKIKEAYGKYWNEIKSATCNKTGWVMSDYFDCRDYNIDCDLDDDNFLWRNKSLQGIENNNGWIKIESEDDLPKEPEFYWVIDKNGIMHQVHYKDITVRYCSHYQLIQKPKPPIY